MIGVSSVWLLSPVLQQNGGANAGVLVACAALGALMPDLDASESKIKHLAIPNTGIKPFSLPAAVLYRQLGHRGLLHSLVGLAIFAVILSPLALAWGWQPWTALVLGYASHLAGDACTRTGIPVLYPRKQRYFLLPAWLRIVTGSDVEEVFFAVFACLGLALLLTVLQ